MRGQQASQLHEPTVMARMSTHKHPRAVRVFCEGANRLRANGACLRARDLQQRLRGTIVEIDPIDSVRVKYRVDDTSHFSNARTPASFLQPWSQILSGTNLSTTSTAAK